MATLTLSAPAKLNLFLHITGRRADGYHNLQTLFQMLDCGDQLSFTLTRDGEIHFSCSDKSIENDSNLVVRAARVVAAFSAQNAGVRIYLDKRVPMGGGLRWRLLRCGDHATGFEPVMAIKTIKRTAL